LRPVGQDHVPELLGNLLLGLHHEQENI
jgi:hypothetical protein